MRTEEVIREAIAGGWCLAMTYRRYSRVVVPRAIETAADGTLLLVAQQIGGGDEAGEIGWKRFELPGIAGARIVREHVAATERRRRDRSLTDDAPLRA